MIRKDKRDQEYENILFDQQKIVDVGMDKEVKKSFIEYSMSVIISRALPDVRDGLKPGQRRVLYAMYEDHATHDRPTQKSAKTVGNVLGRYHPHGDSSVYGTLVRMAQPFSLRYPLVEGSGNFGSVDGDPPAAYRYTEARLDKISDEMLKDLDKNVVEMVPNYDNRLREPSVLPARFPNLLVNGSVGIAVGMATNIPPHNLSETIDATIYRIHNPECTVEELMQFIKGPDFPTWGTIYGTNGIKEAYLTGKGKIQVRAKAEIDEEARRIIITEIPYMVNKSQLCEAIANLVKEKRVEGITDMRDESGRNGMRIVIEYKRDANGQIILNQLYKYSQLQDTCSINMLAIVGNEPKTLNLSQMLDHYIRHQESVITRRTQHELNAALREAHIYEGYKLAIDNLDEVISIIRASEDQPTAKKNLMARFNGEQTDDGSAAALNLEAFAMAEDAHLSEEQAQAIVSMTLGRLCGLERKKIEERLAALNAAIIEYRAILGDINRIRQIICDEMSDIKRRFGDERRTRIEESEDDIVLEDLIEKHDCVITLTHGGYIKRQPASEYAVQHRGGMGKAALTTKEEDFIEKVVVVHSHSNLMLFTNKGRVQMLRAFMIPEASRTAKGTHINNVLELAEGEKITAMISIHEFAEGEYLTMVTKQGIIKRTLLTEYAYHRKGGKIALSLKDDDELVFVTHTYGYPTDLMIATRYGSAVRFTVDDESVRPMGRTATGVRGIKLRGDDYVVGVASVIEGKSLITITENGYGKRTDFDDFRQMKHRGGHGVSCHALSEKTGLLSGINIVDDNDDVMIITDAGTMIRTSAADIPTYSRSAGGVRVMRLAEGQKIVNFTKIARQDELEEVISEVELSDDGQEIVIGQVDKEEVAEIENAESEQQIEENEDNENE